MERMENLSNRAEIDNLIVAMRGEGAVERFPPELTEEMGRSLAIALEKHEKESRIERAKLMKDASRTIIFD
jgi:hypothetical protein